MAIENGNLVLFAHGIQANYEAKVTAGTTDEKTLYFTSDEHNLYLGSNLIGSNVKDASYISGVLTLEMVAGAGIVLDFSDVASSSAVGEAIITAIATAKSDVIGSTGDEWDQDKTLYALKAEIDAVGESGVLSVNELTGDVEIVNGDNVTVETVDGKIKISSSYTDTNTVLSSVSSSTLVTGSSDGSTLTLSDNGLTAALGTKVDTVVVDDVDSDGFISAEIDGDTLTITVDGIQDAIDDAESDALSAAKTYADALDGDTIKVSNETGIAYTGETIADAIDDIDDRLGTVENYTAPAYTIGTTTTTDGYASTYQLYKDGAAVSGSVINIPKDQFLSDATIVTGTVTNGVYSETGSNTYIKLEFQVNGDGIDPGTIYLDVQDFFDVYTAGTGIDITDNEVSNTGVLSVEGVTGDIDLVGSGVTITADATNKTITLSSTDTITTINGRSGVITVGETSTNEDYLSVTDTNGAITIGTSGIGDAISGSLDEAKEYADALSTYDLVIRTQAEFDTMIASPTWLDATSVALVGSFTLTQPTELPSNVRQIHGYSNARISIPDYTGDMAWGNNSGDSCDIRDLHIYDESGNTNFFSNITSLTNITIESVMFSFHNCTNLVNCSGQMAVDLSEVMFDECENLSSCHFTYTGEGGNDSDYGFRNCKNLVNCTASGTNGIGNSYNFQNCTNLVNCIDNLNGESGFYNCTNIGATTDIINGLVSSVSSGNASYITVNDSSDTDGTVKVSAKTGSGGLATYSEASSLASAAQTAATLTWSTF